MRAFRILGFAAWALVLGLLGFFFYDQIERRMVERKLREELANLTAEERHAKIIIDAIREESAAGPATIEFRWAETDKNGAPLKGCEARRFECKGRELFVDAEQIVFSSDQVREGDPLRGKSITLFRSVFGSDQKPVEASPVEVPKAILQGASKLPALDSTEMVPPYFRDRNGQVAEERLRLWRGFREMEVDSARAAGEGVRCVQGTAVHKPVVAGKEYRLTVTSPGQILFEGPFEPDPFAKPER